MSHPSAAEPSPPGPERSLQPGPDGSPEPASERSSLPGSDSGSAVVDFVLVGALTTMVFAAVLQLALVLHVRSTLVDCAAEGARYGAMADRTPEHGAARAAALIEMSLAPRFADAVEARTVTVQGVAVVEVTVEAPLPVIGLIGPAGTLTVRGHALAEVP